MSDDNRNIESHLLNATRRILRPLIRILLRNSVTANVFQELARKVFVDVAYEEFGISGKTQTLARVSVITGLNRKEVARLHKLELFESDAPVWWNRAGTVLAGWSTDEQYHTSAGFPLDLPFVGTFPSFSDLVKQYSGDMYPRAIADELLRVGAIEEHDGKYRMAKRGYSPRTDPALMLDILGLDTAEMIETIDHNIGSQGDGQLMQVKVLANNLPAEHLEAFNKYSKRVSLNAVDEITRWLNEHDAGKDSGGDDARYAAGVGLFQINRLVRNARTEEGSSNE